MVGSGWLKWLAIGKSAARSIVFSWTNEAVLDGAGWRPLLVCQLVLHIHNQILEVDQWRFGVPARSVLKDHRFKVSEVVERLRFA